jgi:hypothetical protein
MGNYEARLERIEARMRLGSCGSGRCLKCVIGSLPVIGDGLPVTPWTGCEGNPVSTLTEILNSMDNRHELRGQA